ncbi:PREDICTED: protein FAR1-RELATED SEQUENCE 5-like [Fragaria vesca subsp. vesca]|uniref:protein FAR1-RELATED SEQUENCE 5-like n=1 Tax=Fragaria vesca subsp. vesca TaxID=101020 RepID=UPI0002C310B3|nr:PREDICTED: protein FAR1-RELATED SEQUENCE 5-like [Fragaria vesca subsp. vesca]
MRALAAKDPHFICRFTTDLEDRLVDIFWRDEHSFVDYQCYGDVLIFDSTYKTNVYNRPLVLFVGSNNHRGRIIFGASLISDETEETYTWLLRTFLESMNGKMPKAVLTDSDEAMRKAIDTVMPKARHRICIWHIGKNAFTHLKSEEELKAFNRCVRKYQTVEQFERLWQEMIEELDLHDDIWIGNMYEKRDKFCQAFFGDIFMAGMRSTQGCEGMNKEFKRVLGKGKSLVELVTLVSRLLMKLRHNQEKDEFINMNFPGVVTHLVDLEIQASSIFTHDVFKWIVREIKKERFITLKQGAKCHEDGSHVYKVSVYKRPEFDNTVVYHPEKETDSAEDPIMVCSCRMFQYRGVPCRHMFTVMINEHIFELHKSLIIKRWSKDARTMCEIPYPDQSMPREALEVSRYGALTAECNRLCFYASKTDAGYNLLQKEISKLSSIVEGFAKEKEKVQAPATPSNIKGNVVRDPIPVRTKGREKMTRRLRLPDDRLLVVIAKVLDTTVKHVMLGRRKKKLRRAMKMTNETLTLVLQLQHL